MNKADATSETVPQIPVVDGILCRSNHFNSPMALYCSVCGVSMVQQTHNIVKGPRPSLGILVLDDGSCATLDTNYIIGREPEEDPEVTSGRARPLALQDNQMSVSRVHGEIRLEGWNVLIMDRGSANGTHVSKRGEGKWTRLDPNSPMQIKPGTNVAIGGRTFVFESSQQR